MYDAYMWKRKVTQADFFSNKVKTINKQEVLQLYLVYVSC